MEPQRLPLGDVRVLEFSHAVLGPACGMILADLGATVVRVERAPDGDDTRRLKGFGTGYFPFFNRNKQSIAVDVKSDVGREIVYKLVADADVVIENFGPGTMERLGLGPVEMMERNPRLIYCVLKGFMPGPHEQRMALDEVVQMMSGLAYMTGPPGQPLRAGASVVDIMSGLYGALGVLVALREREQTGHGQVVRNGLFETAAFIMGHHMAYSAVNQQPVPPMPARVSAWSVYRTFATADDTMVFVGITSDRHWERFCRVFGQEDLLNDERLATNNDRITARDWLLPELERMFATMASTEILRLCEDAAIPFAPVARPEDLFNDPHLNAGGRLLATLLPNDVGAMLPAQPLTLDEVGTKLRSNPPRVGEHTRSLLHSVGYDDATIAALVAAGTVAVDSVDSDGNTG